MSICPDVVRCLGTPKQRFPKSSCWPASVASCSHALLEKVPVTHAWIGAKRDFGDRPGDWPTQAGTFAAGGIRVGRPCRRSVHRGVRPARNLRSPRLGGDCSRNRVPYRAMAAVRLVEKNVDGLHAAFCRCKWARSRAGSERPFRPTRGRRSRIRGRAPRAHANGTTPRFRCLQYRPRWLRSAPTR